MAFFNPSDANEVLYGSSGDVRDEVNVCVLPSTAGHYADETEIPGKLIINSLRKATRVINGFLEPVYSNVVPYTDITSPAKLLDEIANDMATYYVLRSASAKVAPVSAEKKMDYFDVYMEVDKGILWKIREREIQLPELTSQYIDEIKTVRAAGRAPIFDVDKITDQEVDPNLLDDISDERS